MSGALFPEPTSRPIEDCPVPQADLLAHIRLLQDALDATAPTEAALLRADHQIAAMQDQIDRLSQQIASGRRQADALERQVAEVRGSLTWRLTAPLRSVLRILRRVLHRAS